MYDFSGHQGLAKQLQYMVILYALGGYVVAAYLVGGVLYLLPREDNEHIRSWHRFYWCFSPITVPMLISVWMSDRWQ